MADFRIGAGQGHRRSLVQVYGVVEDTERPPPPPRSPGRPDFSRARPSGRPAAGLLCFLASTLCALHPIRGAGAGQAVAQWSRRTPRSRRALSRRRMGLRGVRLLGSMEPGRVRDVRSTFRWRTPLAHPPARPRCRKAASANHLPDPEVNRGCLTSRSGQSRERLGATLNALHLCRKAASTNRPLPTTIEGATTPPGYPQGTLRADRHSRVDVPSNPSGRLRGPRRAHQNSRFDTP